MTHQAPARRLKMNARRRSPFMLLLGFLTAGAPVSAAARGGSPRRERAAAVEESPERRLGEVGWDDFLLEPEAEPWLRTKPEPRVRMLWQTGLQKTFVSGRRQSQPYWRNYPARQITMDLGVLVRDRDSRDHWGGAATVLWQDEYRTLYAVKAIRRWSLDDFGSAYFQVAPGVVIGGEQDDADITPGGLLELEVGNTWVALVTGVHVVGWSTGSRMDWTGQELEAEQGINTTVYAGIRTHGLIGLAAYLALFIAWMAAYSNSYN